MRITETPKRPILLLEDYLIGLHIATVEDETTHRRYAYVERWQAPWNKSASEMVGWAVYDVEESGKLDLSQLSETLVEVEELVVKARLKRPA
jgi:hypothetical protein